MLRRFLLPTLLVRWLRNYRMLASHHSITKRYQLNHYRTDDWGRSEARARDLLARAEKAVSWAPVPLYPAGGAAGPLLLYLLIRILSELPVKRVMELGAGQSTSLFDAWAETKNGALTTFEQDEAWARNARSRLRSKQSQVLYLPLVDTATSRGAVKWYASPTPDVLPKAGFDLLLVDGPVGSTYLSRFGVVTMVPDALAAQWIIVWDDLDRPSDLESFALVVDKLQAAGAACDHVLFDGDRTVGIVYTSAFSSARYFW